MAMVQRRTDTGDIERNVAFLKDQFLLQIMPQIRSSLEMHDEIAILGVVECKVQSDDERVVHDLQSLELRVQHPETSLVS